MVFDIETHSPIKEDPMLFINKKEIQTLDQTLFQTAVKKAYALVLSQDYHMPDRMHVGDGPNTLLLMPCFSQGFFATKLVSVFPQAIQAGQPVVNGVMVLADNKTGQPLALMDGAAITAQRTGAVGGLAVDLLTPQDLETAGIFGAGVQGLSQARYLLFNRPIKKLWIGDLNPSSAQTMAKTLEQEFPRVTCVTSGSAEQLVEACQLVVAATTSTHPLFKADKSLVKGKTFISIGSFRPDMKEFPDEVILNADHVYVDTLFAAKESGDICIPLKNRVVEMEKIQPFAPLITDGIALENKTCFFKSVGMALFDLTAASAVYQLAVKENLGQKLDV